MAQTFSADVDEWILKSKERTMAVFKTALSYTLDEIVDRTPVDTGFLRASLKASLVGYSPLQPGRGVEGAAYQVEPYELVIAGVEDGGTVWANYTADYSSFVEYGSRGRAGRAMVRLSVQNWQENVNRAVARLRDR